VTPFKLWPHLMVKIQQETGNSEFVDVDSVIGNLNSASIDICTQTYTLSADDFEIELCDVSNPNRGVFNVQFTSQSTNGVKSTRS
jgi:hypothetical protein